MKVKSKQKKEPYIHIENKKRIALLNEEEQKEVYKIARYMNKHEYDVVEMNIIISTILDKFLDPLRYKNDLQNQMYKKDFKNFLDKIVAKIPMKEEKMKQKQKDYERFLESCVWGVFSMFLLLLFIQNYFYGTYLINYSIDIIPAILFFYLFIHHFKKKLKIFQYYQFPLRIVYFDLFLFLFCLFMKLLFPTPYDVTFLLFVISYFMNKKKASMLFKNYS